MGQGLPVTKELIDQRVGSLLSQIDRCFRDVVDFDAWIRRTDLGVDTIYGDATGLARIKAATFAVALLWTVSQGQNAVPNASDFWSDVRALIGIP
jgi:hypothetical protein